jgi:hypothetical protein
MYSSIRSLTSALDGSEWSVSRLGRFTPRERAPATHWIGNAAQTVSSPYRIHISVAFWPQWAPVALEFCHIPSYDFICWSFFFWHRVTGNILSQIFLHLAYTSRIVLRAFWPVPSTAPLFLSQILPANSYFYTRQIVADLASAFCLLNFLRNCLCNLHKRWFAEMF